MNDDRSAVLSCVEPACIAETKVTLYDAMTQAWTEMAKTHLRLKYFRVFGQLESRRQVIAMAIPSIAAMMAPNGELRSL
jgi:hypothetical protein